MEFKNMKKTLFTITFAVGIFWLFQNHELLLKGTGQVIKIISPFFIGFMIAFILNVPLKIIEGLWERFLGNNKKDYIKKMKRPMSLVLSFLLVIGILWLIVVLVIPEVGATIAMIVKTLPGYMEMIGTRAEDLLTKYELDYFTRYLESIDWNNFGKILANGGVSFVNTTVSVTSALISGLFNLFLGLVFSIYLLLQKEKLCRQVRNLITAYLPDKVTAYLIKVAEISNRIFSNFIKGQLTEAVILGLLCFLGMCIFSIPYAPAISALICITALIPMFGAFIGMVIGIFLILMADPGKTIWFIIFFIVLQQLEGNLIYPKVVGKSVGLPGIWVLFSITIGGSLFGVLGMLISVPACSVVYTLLQESVHFRLQKKQIDKKEKR